MEEKEMMRPDNQMDMDALQDTEMLENQMLEEAKRLDEQEMEEMQVTGEYSERMLNRTVDSLNRVLKIFRAPEYPKFESGSEILPPEFVKQLSMVNIAAQDAMIDDKTFDPKPRNDADLRQVAGKLDALAGDKAFKAFLNKPQGMGEIQDDMRVPSTEMSGGSTNVQRTNPVRDEVDVNALFMSRM